MLESFMAGCVIGSLLMLVFLIIWTVVEDKAEKRKNEKSAVNDALSQLQRQIECQEDRFNDKIERLWMELNSQREQVNGGLQQG